MMCHHGDADEGWRHCDLTAVLSAGSSDTIRIHQQRRSVTFPPLGSLWKNVGAADELQLKNTIYFSGKGKKKTSIRRASADSFLFSNAKKTKSVKVLLRKCRFSPSQQRKGNLLALLNKLVGTSSEKSPCCYSTDCGRTTKDKSISFTAVNQKRVKSFYI